MQLVNHLYVSTACQHAIHEYCKSSEGARGPKKAMTCKFCSARCLCPCHEAEESEGER